MSTEQQTRSPQQEAALSFLRERPGATTMELVLDARLGGRRHAGYDWAHGLLVRMEKRGLVTRSGSPAKWRAVG